MSLLFSHERKHSTSQTRALPASAVVLPFLQLGKIVIEYSVLGQQLPSELKKTRCDFDPEAAVGAAHGKKLYNFSSPHNERAAKAFYGAAALQFRAGKPSHLHAIRCNRKLSNTHANRAWNSQRLQVSAYLYLRCVRKIHGRAIYNQSCAEVVDRPHLD